MHASSRLLKQQEINAKEILIHLPNLLFHHKLLSNEDPACTITDFKTGSIMWQDKGSSYREIEKYYCISQNGIYGIVHCTVSFCGRILPWLQQSLKYLLPVSLPHSTIAGNWQDRKMQFKFIKLKFHSFC